MADLALPTSGASPRYLIQDGRRIHHILSPQTGKSLAGLASVPVLCDNSIDADALSTSVFVLGAEKGLALINRLPGTSAIIIDRKGNVTYSDDLTGG